LSWGCVRSGHALALQNKREIYGLLFRNSAATLLQIGRDPRHLGVDPGFFSVLHTWNQQLLSRSHPLDSGALEFLFPDESPQAGIPWQHNIYTLRGALVRDALEWSKQINIALYRFGQEAETMFSAHSWPRWGNARIQGVMPTQRDIYANLNNEVLHLVNQGVTINEIHNVYKPPRSLQNQWAVHSYHGSEEHNSRGVVNRYLGYWDSNPATLIPHSPRDSALLYVEMMGGAAKTVAKGKELYNQGNCRHAMEILNKLVHAEPANQVAKDLLADVFEQISYQKESSSVRNSFLGAAYELRSGIPGGTPPSRSGPDMVRAMSTNLWLDFLAIRLDSKKAEGIKFVINLVTPDNGEKFVIEMSNSTLTNIEGVQTKNPDLTVTINRSDLATIIMGTATFDDLVAAGRAKIDGNRKPFDQLRSILVQFTPDFEMMPGTKAAKAATPPAKDPFEQAELGRSDGG
jgi:alkyl sulfatase BDS1-like metallo-beta-lactamase superfamily hydrolase